LKYVKDRPELDSIISTAQTQTAFLDDPCLRESLSASDFDFAALKTHKTTIYLILPADLIAVYAKWFRLLVVCSLNAMTKTQNRGNKPVLFMLDEFASLGYLSTIENAMGLVRGYGVQLWPFVQDIHQLQDLYGKRWQSFLANAGVQQYFCPNDMETAKFISERAGNMTIRTHTVNQSQGSSTSNTNAAGGGTTESTSRSYTEMGVPLLPALDLMGMGYTMGVVFIGGTYKTLRYFKMDYWKVDYFKGKYADNPYVDKEADGQAHKALAKPTPPPVPNKPTASPKEELW
jgi:type IV secretion system protein VirD4